ncbi:MAG: flagellin, partial [Methanomicrobiales archaeon HGW-Methanomicrobiales-2]
MPQERSDRAFTGLEAAIVFIAFIVVASVFAYVVLGVGMTTSQKSQEVMHAALGEAGSALRPGSVVIAKLDATGLLDFVEFDLETATDLAAIDMGSMTYTIATTESLVTFPPGDPRVTEKWRYQKKPRDLLGGGGGGPGEGGTGRPGVPGGGTFGPPEVAPGGGAPFLS